MWRSLSTRLWGSSLLLVILTLLAIGLALSQLLAVFIYQERSRELLNEGRRMALLLQTNPTQETLGYLSFFSEFIDANVMVVDRNGLVMACAPGMGLEPGIHLSDVDTKKVLEGNEVIRRGYHQQFANVMLTVAVPVIGPGRNVLGAVLFYAPVAPMEESVRAMHRLIFYAAIWAVALATLISFFVSRRISLPLQELKEVAGQIADGDLSGRVEIKSGDEIGTLGQAFNFMAEELEANLDALSSEKERLSGILAGMTDGVVGLDENGVIILANTQAENLLGGPLGQGRQLAGSGPEGLLRQALSSVLAAKMESENELVIAGRYLALRAAPLRDRTGEARGVVAVLQDVTRQKKQESLRREFAAGVSHELRTPLSFIQGYGEALLDGVAESPEEQKDYLRIILEETARLRRLVEDLMDLGSMEAGQLRLVRELVNLGPLVEGVCRKYLKRAEDAGLRLKWQVVGELPWIYGDELRLEQVIGNLLNNAFQHTVAGERVEVVVFSTEGEVTASVTDSGAGIPEADLPFVWDSFYRVDKARTRQGGGYGLGLAIVRQIVLAHGGRVQARSTPGQGSIFSFSLPVPLPGTGR